MRISKPVGPAATPVGPVTTPVGPVTTLLIVSCLVMVSTAGCSGLARNFHIGAEVALEETVVSLLNKATRQMRLGTSSGYDQANAALEVARDLSAEDPRILDGLGCVEWRRRNYDLAESFFKRAIATEPNYDRAYAHLAFVAERTGDLNAAYDLLKIAVAMNPVNYRSRNNLAMIALSKGYDKQSYRQLLRAYQSGGKNQPVIELNLRHFGSKAQKTATRKR